MTVTGHIG